MSALLILYFVVGSVFLALLFGFVAWAHDMFRRHK